MKILSFLPFSALCGLTGCQATPPQPTVLERHYAREQAKDDAYLAAVRKFRDETKMSYLSMPMEEVRQLSPQGKEIWVRFKTEDELSKMKERSDREFEAANPLPAAQRSP